MASISLSDIRSKPVEDLPEHRESINKEVFNAIKDGKLKIVEDWVKSLTSSGTNVDDVRYYPVQGDSLSAYGYRSLTALHIAAMYNQVVIAEFLISNGAGVNDVRISGRVISSVLHCACAVIGKEDKTELVKLILEREGDVHAKAGYGETPLHEAAGNGQSNAVVLLLKKGANVDEQDDNGNTALHYAALFSHASVAKVLLEWNANVKLQNNDGEKPIHTAVLWGRRRVFDVLIEKNTDCLYWKNDEGRTPLDIAVKTGYKEIVESVIESHQWQSAMRYTHNDSTPFREMIRTMPDMALKVLNKCTVSHPYNNNKNDPIFSVVFNYEFVEDTGHDNTDHTSADNELIEIDTKQFDSEFENIIEMTTANLDDDEREHVRPKSTDYSTSWGPTKFDKKKHPLAIMVKEKCSELLTHPLIGSLLFYKWKKFGFLLYLLNLLLYALFLLFLTTFAFIVDNPQDQSCSKFALNVTGSDVDCGISAARRSFIYISAVVVIILAFFRIIIEGYQFVSDLRGYIFDGINIIEVTSFYCSIIFVWIFHNNCLCPLTWQWQTGVAALFLGWLGLTAFVSKLPFIGIYVLMFFNIVRTFSKIIVLLLLLVLTFGLTFFMAFRDPLIQRSAFSTIDRSLVTIISMTGGDFSSDSNFRLDPTGANDDAEEIPFLPISYILWIVFVIAMPILFANLLTGVAVDDVNSIQKAAKLNRIALQVNHVLTVEGLLPRKLRRYFARGHQVVYPNRGLSHDVVYHEKQRLYRFRVWYERLQFMIWGGDVDDSYRSIIKLLHPPEDEVEKVGKKVDKVTEDIKRGNEKIEELIEEVGTIKEAHSKAAQEMQDIKTGNQKIEELIKEVGIIKGAHAETAQDMQEIKASIQEMKAWMEKYIQARGE